MKSIYNEGNHTNWDLEIIVIANKTGWARFDTNNTNQAIANIAQQMNNEPYHKSQVPLNNQQIMFNTDPWNTWEYDSKQQWLNDICPSKIRITKPIDCVQVLNKTHEYMPDVRQAPYPTAWYQTSLRLHTPGLGIYTDGSRMEQENGEFLAGVGIYYESTSAGESYKFGDANAILKAELDGIRIATENPAQEGENSRKIYTDSLNSLQLLEKMRQYPNKMQKHRYAETIRTILLHASTLKNQNNEDVPVHMYKVAAHT